MGFPLTEEQKKIVEDRGGELLVSAAAGSGKTRVLVERLMDRVTREGLDIDQFLVITYTKAAAAELRGRIAQELSQRLALSPNDRHLRRQATLIYQAPISTIHSFCSGLLRENGHMLDLDPDFRLCDEGEGQVLQRQVLEELLDGKYVGLQPQDPFAVLVDTLSVGRDDSRLAEITMDIFRRIQSHADPQRWLEEQTAIWTGLDEVEGAEDTIWGRLLLDRAGQVCRTCLTQLKEAAALADTDELLQRNYLPGLQQSCAALTGLIEALDRGWDSAQENLEVPFPRVGTGRKRKETADEAQLQYAAETTVRVKSLRDGCKGRLRKLKELLDGSSRQVLDDLREVAPAVTALLQLVGEFDRAYSREKARRSMLDFSDLEHFAVKLLWKEGRPTQLARHWSARFAEVMVDEYQDTNQVQNVIFSAISDGGRTLFEVGDVKQSIYRFRLADPTIFLEKYRAFPAGDKAESGGPRTRVLSKNFRSRGEILTACNDLFRNVMSTQLGEMEYTADQMLDPGGVFPAVDENPVELALLDLSERGEEDEREDKDLMEARYAAARIRALLDQPLMLREGDGLRPVTPSDVMILLRSPGRVLGHYIRALEEQGIPWSADSGENFFESTEIHVALSLLQIVDNPRQDVALIAALRSPVYGFTGDELALLRADGRDGDFYSAVVKAGEEGNEKCVRFLRQLEQLRFGMGDRTCRQMVWHIYECTNLLGLFSAMDPSGQRRDNLLALYTLAGRMEESGCRTLFQFLLRLERLRESGKKVEVNPGGGEGDGVSILSIHRSKGLEKPVVLVCGLGRRFNTDDFKRPVLFHPVYGVGPRGLDRERMVEYPTLARQGVQLQLRREMLAEELRLLYVAMTRAQEKLILTLGLTKGLATVGSLGVDAAVPQDPMTLYEQDNPGAWVLLYALTRPEASFLRTMASLPEVVDRLAGPAWKIDWIDGAMYLQPPARRSAPRDGSRDGGEDRELLREALLWSYPYEEAVNLPSKVTATQLAERGGLITRAPGENWQVGRPRFVSEEQGLTPAERGTALHMAMQALPVGGDHSEEGIRRQLDRLAGEEFLTPQQVQAADPGRIAAFYRSELGQKVERAPVCHQEFPFSVLIPAGELDAGAQGEQVLLQGIIDCWFEDGDGITVLDFKSDRIRPGDESRRAARYRPQIMAYARALQEMTGRPVVRRVLWFFATDTAFEVK